MSVLGLLVNPIAGMGGRLGLHGTDGSALTTAIESGAELVAGPRMRRAIDRLAALAPDLRVLTVGGPMGDGLTGPGWSVEQSWATTGPTTAADTRRAVSQMVRSGVDLVLFGGGDGTARDVADALGPEIPMLGVPCGVKMHSGVFATGPQAAGELAARYLAHPGQVGQAEIVDVDADGPRIYAVATVPAVGVGLQAAKRTGSTDSAELSRLGRAMADEMVPDRLYLLGPGLTVAQVSAALGVPASLRGVDAVIGGRLVAADASERELLALLAAASVATRDVADRPSATLILGVVGGQGFLLGRGNQQLSPAVLRALGPMNIDIIAGAGKVAALDPPVLRVDLDDPDLSAILTGYRRVRTSRRHSTVLRIVA